MFHDYLVHLVNTAQDDFRIILHTTIPESPKQTIDFTRAPRGDTVKEIEIRVLTPAFYSRFVHYAHTSEAFDRECIFTDEKNRTCWVSRPELLAQLLNRSGNSTLRDTLRSSFIDEMRWSLLKSLRCAPAEPAYNATPMDSEFRLEDIRAVKHSEMDYFIRHQQDHMRAGVYRRIVTKLFLAQRFCLGFPQIITVGDWVLRSTLCYFAARQVSGSNDLGRGVFHDKTWWSVAQGIIALTASHVYGLLKGYC